MSAEFALAACSAETVTDTPATSPSAGAALSKGGVEHSVTGSGLQDIFPGFKYTIEASVHSDADGNVSGQIHVRVLDLSTFGIAPYEVEGVPTCMRVVGNTAYIGEVITKTTDPVNARALQIREENADGRANDGAKPGALFLRLRQNVDDFGERRPPNAQLRCKESNMVALNCAS